MTVLKSIIMICCLLMVGKQVQAHQACAENKKQKGIHAKTTSAVPEQNDYDVKHVKIDLNMTNTATTISGSTTTTAQVLASTLQDYWFELHTDLTIDSVIYQGQAIVCTTINGIRKATLPTALAQGQLFTVRIFYHGTPGNGNGFFSRGLTRVQASATAAIVYSCSDPNWADDWWACKQNILDKIDSADIWITVPNDLKAGSNGLLKNITPVSATHHRFEWQTKYPIDYYLISVAVGPYADYSYYMHFSNSTDSMLVQNYVYDSSTYMVTKAKVFDTTGLIVDHFSTLFGRYPFWKEKYGHCLAVPLGGGMEHQTMTTIGGPVDAPLVAHELGHQWWGNSVTYSSWADIWLSEGFASYCEHLFLEHFRGAAAAKSFRNSSINNAISIVGGSVIFTDTNNVYRVFDSRLTYNKGAMAVHMLRYELNDDNLFFTALKNYQSQFQYGSANTQQFKNIVEQASGKNLDTFFNQWIYKQGYPRYDVRWMQSGNTVWVKLKQNSSMPSSVPLFYTHLDVRLQSNSGDTTFRIYNDNSEQLLSFTFAKTITGVEIDPDNHILDRVTSNLNDPTLSLKDEKFATQMLTVAPNPADSFWKISGFETSVYVVNLYNNFGQKLSSIKVKNQTQIEIPAAHLASGQYYIEVKHKGKTIQTLHLQR